MFKIRCEPKTLSKSVMNLDKSFDDIIVGWKIESLRDDDKNGDWEFDNNPLLKKRIKIKFTSRFWRTQKYNVYVYLMVSP